jgi:hypothetical protein
MRVEFGYVDSDDEESLTLYYVTDENLSNTKASYSYHQP